MNVRTCVLSILVLGSTFFLLFCGPGPRPGELVKADRLMQDKQAKTRAAQAAPQVFQFADRYYKLAEDHFAMTIKKGSTRLSRDCLFWLPDLNSPGLGIYLAR